MTVFILIIPAICIIGAYDSENSSFCFVLCVIYSNFVIKKLYENMGRGKLEKFADMERYENVFEYPYHVMEQRPFDMKGQWRERYFKNDGAIVLELGCGRGEYTVELAKRFPETNFIGVDIKGARMWSGATQALEEKLPNVAFLRTNIEIIDRFFDCDEVQEIWLTFSDPQMKSVRKRLTSTYFMNRYRKFLTDGGLIHLKTDSNFLFTYTLGIKTYYETQWIERGLNIRYMKFRLPHGGELHEPDVEIPLDEYRSYKRTKRSGLSVAK